MSQNLDRTSGEPQGFDWDAAGFPVYRPVVYRATLLSSLAILALASWRPRAPRHPVPHALDFGVAVAAITLASPVAWLHHFGAFFALFALAAAVLCFGARPMHHRRVAAAALVVSYLLLSNALLRPELIFTGRWSGLLGSHGWVGALLMMGLLMRLRDGRPQAAATPQGMGSNGKT